MGVEFVPHVLQDKGSGVIHPEIWCLHGRLAEKPERGGLLFRGEYSACVQTAVWALHGCTVARGPEEGLQRPGQE
jgi:hypothetical protein